ncbi:MAG TPA: bile acid:sodium symporter family protein [Verrucomicrobia bacterium]|nr:bile acid:sodium symporter family protein [Verrucomicrobiota bacterium]HOP96988.1 bile acid:sodium symporter family protein [Verrucomicrobiota bacterium]HPU55597.1 bile acid:sodium symporter family protein [Verrucomicrobiota bacterium]
MHSLLALLTNCFPVWVLAGGALALVRPGWFTWFSGEFITWGLAVIMLGMGITLSVDDFKAVFRHPRRIAAGVAAQYLLMPLLGWSVARLLQLEPGVAVGLILVACCPGGTASNVVTYLARANVPLSVLMTMCSTFAAIMFTPLLTKWLAGQYVPVDGWGLFVSTVKIVLAPLVIGLVLNRYAAGLVQKVLPVAPLVSVLTITLICASIIGESADRLKAAGAVLPLAVFLLHAGGFALGYAFGRVFGFPAVDRRTISIEVGMQNSGLGAALASRHFPLMPEAALSCAISATFHSVIGSLLAGYWRLRPVSRTPSPAAAAPAVVLTRQ